MAILFLVSRILFGGYFIYNGISHLVKAGPLAGYAASKGVPMPKTSVVVSGIMILLGGLGILLWAYVPIAILLIVLFLLAVTPMMHAFWKVSDPMTKMNEQISFLKNMALLGAAIAYLFIPIF